MKIKDNITIDYKKEVEYMVDLVIEACKKEVLPRWWNVIAKEKWYKKQFRDIVTEADLKTSEYILNHIRPKFPGSYSEEHKFLDRFSNDLIWQIDPVDWTDEFCEEIIDGYACHAALLKRAQDDIFYSVAWIIYLPGVDKLWYNYGLNKGVIFINKWIKKVIPNNSRDKLVWYIRNVDQNEKLKQFYNVLWKKLNIPSKTILSWWAWASISDLLEWKINLIVMNYNYTKEWDLAMAEPIIKELGWFICDFDGNDFIYNRQDVDKLDEPYNLNGYVISIVFNKDEIISNIPKDLLINKL